MRKNEALGVVAGVVLALPVSAAGADLESRWHAGGVTSDPRSWLGVPFESEGGLEIGAVNDAAHLYICLYPRTARDQFYLLRSGATVWMLDAHGDRRGAVRFRGSPPAGSPPRPPEGPRDAPDPRELRERADEALPELDILDADGDVIETRSRAAGGDVEVRVEASELVYYVVRIPLAAREKEALAAGAEPGATIGIGVETPRFERPIRRDRRRGGPADGSPDAPPDAPEEGAAGEQPAGEGSPPEPVRFWTALVLGTPEELPGVPSAR